MTPPVWLSPYDVTAPPPTVARVPLFIAVDLPTKMVEEFTTKPIVLFDTTQCSTAIMLPPSARIPVPFDAETESETVAVMPFATATPNAQLATRELLIVTFEPFDPLAGKTENPRDPTFPTV